jgi:hypothetical protein
MDVELSNSDVEIICVEHVHQCLVCVHSATVRVFVYVYVRVCTFNFVLCCSMCLAHLDFVRCCTNTHARTHTHTYTHRHTHAHTHTHTHTHTHRTHTRTRTPLAANAHVDKMITSAVESKVSRGPGGTPSLAKASLSFDLSCVLSSAAIKETPCNSWKIR